MFLFPFFVLIFCASKKNGKHKMKRNATHSQKTENKMKRNASKKKRKTWNEKKRKHPWWASRSDATPTNQSFGVCKVNLADPKSRNYSQFAVYYLIANMTVLFVVSREMRRAGRRSHARFHFVTDLAKWLTVHGRSGLPILAKCKHFNTLWEPISNNSPTISRSLWFYLVIVQARRGQSSCAPLRNSVQHTFLTVTFHVLAPSYDVFRIFLFGFDICACADQLRV